MKKRILSLLLVLVMLLGLLPTVALAADSYTATVIFDLTGVTPEQIKCATVALADSNGTKTLVAGKKNTFVYDKQKIKEAVGPAGWTEFIISLTFTSDILASGKVQRASDGKEWTFEGDDEVGICMDDPKDEEGGLWISAAANNRLDLFLNTDSFSEKTQDTWTITPVFGSAGFTATALPDSNEHGSVTATKTGRNAYRFSVKENDNWTFSGWTAEPAAALPEAQKNAYDLSVTLTSDAAFTAHYLPWKAASGESDPADVSQITAKRSRGNSWYLSYQDSADYTFQYWSKKGDNTELTRNNMLSTGELTEDTVYVAHFIKNRLTGISNIAVSASSNDPGKDSSSQPLVADSKIYFRVTTTSEGNTPVGQLRIYKGSEAAVKQAIADGTADELLLAGTTLARRKYTTASIEAWPNYTGKLTAVAYADNAEDAKVYGEVEVKTIQPEAGFLLSYLSLPKNYNSGEGITGTHVHDTAAYIDKENGGVDLYIAGVGGVYKMDYSGKTAMTQMAGQSDLNTNDASDLNKNGYA